ncbi:MAG: MFS transporter [Chloroflexi bacterium]|nr:MFS transporter [Chloroflexota bacterium]
MAVGVPPVGVGRDRWAMFSALHYQNYRFYWFGQFPSVLAQNMQFVAVSWLVLQLTNSPAMLGVAGLVQTIPNVALSFLGGAVADRSDRKRLLILTQAITAALYFSVGTLVVTGLVEVWHVLVVGFFLGCVRAFDQPTRQGLLPLLVPTEEIPNAVPLGNLVWQGTRLVGPAIAGMLIYLIGIGQTYYVACGGFVIAMLLFSQLHPDVDPPKEGNSSILRDIVDGMNFIRTNDIVFALLGLTFFDSVFGMSYQILLPIFARDILDVGSQGFGFLQTSAGVGALLGTFIVAATSHSGRRGWQALIGAGAFGLLIVAFTASGSYILSLGIMLLMGMSNQTYMTTVNTALQMNLPNAFRGRVMGIWGLTYSLQPLGGTIAGTMAEYVGVPIALAVGGALVTLMAVTAAVRLPRVRNL